MKVILEKGETLIGRSHLILNKNCLYVEKHYLSKEFINDVKFATKLMKLSQEELFVSEDMREDCYVVTQQYIPHVISRKGYREDISNYLKLIDTLKYDWSKRDLQHYNLIYRSKDDKPFLIDWDDYVTLGSKQKAYNWYKRELTGHKWLKLYDITQQEANNIFDKEWKNV